MWPRNEAPFCFKPVKQEQDEGKQPLLEGSMAHLVASELSVRINCLHEIKSVILSFVSCVLHIHNINKICNKHTYDFSRELAVNIYQHTTSPHPAPAWWQFCRAEFLSRLPLCSSDHTFYSRPWLRPALQCQCQQRGRMPCVSLGPLQHPSPVGLGPSVPQVFGWVPVKAESSSRAQPLLPILDLEILV